MGGMFDSTKVAAEICRGDTALWFENYATIIDDQGNTRERPRLNAHQRKILNVVKWCGDNNRPCRIVGLKPRRKGSSTISVAVGYDFLASKPGRRGLIAGGAVKQTKTMMRMLRTYGTTDGLGRPFKPLSAGAVFGTGSEMDTLTLATPNAGRGDGYQFMLITEVAYLAEEGVANATDQLNGLLKCVKFLPDTIVIQESTAKGAQGDFFDTYNTGISFEELQAGRNGYVKIFSAWFEFEDSRLDPASEGIESPDDYAPQEAHYAELYGLDEWQVAWMRYQIREECKKDFDKFLQDYPFDDETCFLKSGSCRFNQAGLEVQKRAIELQPPLEYGRVNYRESDDRSLYELTDELSAQLVMCERPKVNCRYLISVDTSEGDSQTSGKDPDSHAIAVHRLHYYDPVSGLHFPHRIVAWNNCIRDGTRFGCWWDIDVVEEVVYGLSRYYGGCVIVPEMNADRGLVELLKLRPRANIYRRQEFNQRESKTTEHYGWKTTPNNRNAIIEALATAIRDFEMPQEAIALSSPWLLKECRNFVVKANGRAEAASGHHDDMVMSVAIGHYCRSHATLYRENVSRERELPRDLRTPGHRTGMLRHQNS